MVPRKQFSRDFRVTLVHKVLVDHPSAVTRVLWDVLLTDHMRGPIHPILAEPRRSAKHIRVDIFMGGQHYLVGSVSVHLHLLDVLLVSTGKTDFSIDRAGSLSAKVVFGWHETCVTGEVFPVPVGGRV